MPTRSPKDDLVHAVNKLVVVCSALMERHSRLSEEYDSNRLALEELREILSDHFEENARASDVISRRLNRLEQYVVLSRMGETDKAREITQVVTGEHLRRGLREELGNQQELLQQYQKNVDRVKLRIAKYGETTPLVNELDDNMREIAKVNEAIERIREALN